MAGMNGTSLVSNREPYVQLVTNIPKPLHRKLKLHAIRRDTKIQTVVAEAVREKLDREGSHA